MWDTEEKRLKGSERMRVPPKKIQTCFPPVPCAGPIRETDCSDGSHGLVPRASNIISSSHSIKTDTKAQMSFSTWTVPSVLV